MKRALLCLSVDAIGASLLPWVLQQAGVETDLVGHPRLAAAASRFVRERIPAEKKGQSVRDAFENWLSQHPERYDIVLSDEPFLRTFAERPASPNSVRLLPVTANAGRFARLISKVEFITDARMAGVPVPQGHRLVDAAELQRKRWTGTPFVVKAAVSMSGSGVRLIRSEEDLEAAKDSGLFGPLVIEEMLEGRLGATAVLYRRGIPQCWYSYWLLRNWPNPLAAASAFELYWDPQIESILRNIGEFTEADGLCGLDWIQKSGTGEIKIIEMNLRPTPGLHFGRHAGVSFPKAIAAWAEGRELVQRPAQVSGTVLRLWPQNLYPSIERKEPLEFLRSFANAPLADPALVTAHLRRLLTHHLPQGLRSSLRTALRPQG